MYSCGYLSIQIICGFGSTVLCSWRNATACRGSQTTNGLTMLPTTEKRGRGRPPGRRVEYDEPLVVRIPTAVRAGLDAFAKKSNKKLAVVAREMFAPWRWYSTPAGQDALHVIELVVGLSTTIHKGYEEFGTNPTPATWYGADVLNFGSEETPRYVHTVKQKENQTRDEAVANYAVNVWACVANIEDDEQRQQAVNDLRDDTKHAFVVAFVTMRNWRVFPTTVELSAYERAWPRGQGKTPTTPDEQEIYEHFLQRFNEWFVACGVVRSTPDNYKMIRLDKDVHKELKANAKANGRSVQKELETVLSGIYSNELQTEDALTNGKNNRWVLFDGKQNNPNPTDEGFRMWHELRWFPDETPNEAFNRWARTMVARYVEWRDAIMENPTLFEVATPAGYLANNANDGFAVTTLRWLNDAKEKTKRGTK